MKRKTKGCNHTTEEIEESEYVKQQCELRLLVIYEYLSVCHLTIEDLCIYLCVDVSTFTDKRTTPHSSR